MGSKVSSNQHFGRAPGHGRAASAERILRKSNGSMSSSAITMEKSEESNHCRRGSDIIAGDSVNGIAGLDPSEGFHGNSDRILAEESPFDIDENFDFDSDDAPVIDSDIVSMDDIIDGFNVVELSEQYDVDISRRHRANKCATPPGNYSEPDALAQNQNTRSGKADVPNGDIPRPSPSHSAQRTPKRGAAPPVVYKMDYANRGRAMVVNQTRFDPITGMSNREGTDPDVEGLERVLSHLGFQVEVHRDLNVTDFRRLILTVSGEDFSKDDCFVFIAMSHGEEGVLYCTDGTVCIDEVALRFKGTMCPTLVSKPKLFFIQACRGTLMDHGIRTPAAQGDDEPDAALEQKMFYTIPVEADFLMAYSSTPGYYSWRSLREGSWFIQALILILEKYGTCMDVVQMMTRVNRTVAYRYESISSDERFNGRKQMPCFVSTLTKELYFIPKK